MRILPCNHIISEPTSSPGENYIPDNTQYGQERNLADLNNPHTPRNRYWAEQAARHANWVANGGFAQEEDGLPSMPTIDLRTMPNDRLVRDFYWFSTQVLARMRRPAARRGDKDQPARDCPK